MSSRSDMTALERRIKALEAEIDRLKYARKDEDGDSVGYRRFVENAVMGIYKANSAGQLLMVNRKIVEMFGYASKEEVFATVGNIMHLYADPSQRGRFVQEIDEKGYAARRDVELVKKSGEPMWAEIHARKVTHADGEVVYEGFIQDRTDRMRVEAQLRLSQRCLEKASIGIFRVGEDAKILDVNEQACINLGYTRQELCNLRIFDIDPEFNPERWKEHVKHLQAQGAKTIETVHQHKDGSRFPVEILIDVVEHENKRFHMAFVQDITERKQAEQLKAQLLQSQKMEAIGQLAGGIAHDFNNILGFIMGYTQLAQRSLPASAKERNYIDLVLDASQRAKHLVQQILTFSRQTKTEKMPLDISAVVAEALSMIRPILPASIDLRETIGTDLGTVLADQTQLHQVIMNLCTNAQHAMKRHGGTLSVTLAAVTIGAADASSLPDLQAGRYVQLTVADTGHGMDAGTLQHIFEPYFTTKEAGEGSGIGLATVYGIVKDHGGAITASSEPDKGTTFDVYLPVVDRDGDGAAEEGNHLPPGTETILLVDDEAALAEIGRDMLQLLGYTVNCRTSPHDALEAFKNDPTKYQLVMTDMAMPMMSGVELARAIKKIRPDLPIILYSGIGRKFRRTAADDALFDRILMKPLTIEELAHAVRAALDGNG